MLKKLLRNIRQKPKAVREQYAFWIACVATSVVALAWGAQFMTPRASTDDAQSQTKVVAPDTLSSFMESAQGQLDAVQQEITNLAPAATSTAPVVDIDVATAGLDLEVIRSTATPAESRSEVRIATTSASTTL